MKIRTFSVLLGFALLLGTHASCSSSDKDGQSSDSEDGGVVCGTAGASMCHQGPWPRLVVLFGDPVAASWSYSVLQNGEPFSASPCLKSEENPDYHCDVAFYGHPGLTTMTLQITVEEGGPTAASSVVQLRPFNYCGDDIAEVTVSSSDGGEPVLSEPAFENACGI